MKKIDFDLDDLTNGALKRLVRTLLTTSDAEEEKIMRQLLKRAKKKPEEDKNDLADLVEEKRGKAPKIEVEVEEGEDDNEEDS